jgi:menaquinone-9 beta-reductase
VRLGLRDEIFRVGNAAGEAHPILGEGMSMALQSAALLCSHLLGTPPGRQAPAALRQAQLQQAYASAWQRHFLPRMRVAAVFAHAAMRPRSAALLMALAGRWPDLLTRGARWGGKVQALAPALHGTLAGAPLPSPAHLEGERP